MALPAPALAGLCKPDEHVYFSCQTKAGKMISLCGDAPKTLQYRFGTPQNIELAYPTDARTGTKHFHYAHYWRAQTDYTSLSFTNKEASYVLGHYRSEDDVTGSIEVVEGEKSIEIDCKPPIINDLPALEGMLPCDKESALVNCDK